MILDSSGRGTSDVGQIGMKKSDPVFALQHMKTCPDCLETQQSELDVMEKARRVMLHALRLQ